MVTLFTNPRPFTGPFRRLQLNALHTWLALKPECEVILVDDEEHTTAEVAASLGLRVIQGLRCNEYGTPLLDAVFARVAAEARHPILAQVNTDILLPPDFAEHLGRVHALRAGQPYLLVGRRWDLDFEETLERGAQDWTHLRALVAERGRLHGLTGMDYWVFPKALDFSPPPFVVGRPGMDPWLVYRSRRTGVPVIDATSCIQIIHQNHDYPLKRSPGFVVECRRNRALAQSNWWGMSLRDADWVYDGRQLHRPPWPRRFWSLMSLFWPWRALLALKRTLQARA